MGCIVAYNSIICLLSSVLGFINLNKPIGGIKQTETEFFVHYVLDIVKLGKDRLDSVISGKILVEHFILLAMADQQDLGLILLKKNL